MFQRKTIHPHKSYWMRGITRVISMALFFCLHLSVLILANPANLFANPITINNDSQYINSNTVTLTLPKQDIPNSGNISKMSFSNNNISWSTPESFNPTKTWILSLLGNVTQTGKVNIGDAMFIAQYLVGKRQLTSDQLYLADANQNDKVDIGDPMTIAQYLAGKRPSLPVKKAIKTVYAKFQDTQGNWSDVYSDTILLDSAPPKTTTTGIDTAWKNTPVTISISSTDSGIGLDKIYYSTDGSTPTKEYTTSFILSNDGTYTIKYYSKDKLGNTEAVKTGEVKIDTAPPETSISDIPVSWLTQAKAITLTAKDNGSGIKETLYSFDGSEPSMKYASPYFVLSNEGTFTIKYLSIDNASNRETTKTATTQVKIDKTPPQGSISINDNAEYTNSKTASLNLLAQDTTSGMGENSQMSFSTNNTTWSTPEPYAVTKAWDLTTGEGDNKVYVKFKDTAGNWSTPVSDTIILDTHPPILASTTGFVINNNAQYANSTKVTLSLAAQDTLSGLNQMSFSNDNSIWSEPEAYTASKDWFLDSADGAKTVYVKFSDIIGNWSEAYSDSVTLDKTSPQGSIRINNDSQYTNSTTVTLNLSATDSLSGLHQMQFSNDNQIWSSPEAYTVTKIWDLGSGDGTKTVYAKFKDAAGHWSDVYSDTITLDKIPPSISINPVTSPTNQNVVLSYSVSDNLTPAEQIVVSGDNSPYISEGSHNVSLTARDLAGNNKTASLSFIIDKSAPEIKITSPQNGAVVEDSQIQLQGTIDGVSFSETRTLKEGENTLTKVSTDAAGNSSSLSVTVYLYLGQLIGPEGGKVESVDGRIKVIIPEGALSEYKQIKVLTVNKEILEKFAPAGTTLLSVVECKPYDLKFNKPVSLIYRLYQAEVAGTTVKLGLYNSILKTIKLEEGRDTKVPEDGYTCNFSITHFSTYAALKAIPPLGPPIGAGVRVPLPDMLTGSFSHSVPLTIPPGRKGMQPNLVLSYHSSNPNSWVGLGFSLNPGYIIRSTRLGPPKYNDTEDTFYFVTDAGTTELANLVDNLYQAKIESSFTKFYKVDDTWKALNKDGSILIFGKDPDAKETSSKGTFSWYLTKVIDTNGNYIEYRYTKDSGKAYLSRIDYTGNELAGLSPTNTVEFFLEARTDKMSSYISSAKITTAKRLKEIQASLNSKLVWRYVLEYGDSQDTRRSLLKSVAQFGADGKSLPAQEFEYQRKK